jgi:pimeloyl-ACP methyl ester carboxylesterase
MGAKVVLAAALAAPERFTGLVIVDGAWAVPAPGGAAEALIAGCRSDYRTTIEAFVDACVPEPDGANARRWARHIVHRSSGEPAAQLLEAAGAVDIADRLGEIALPTLILHGAEDRIVPVAQAHMLASRLGDARLVVLDEAGHVPTLTRPRQVAEAIDAFFPAPDR